MNCRGCELIAPLEKGLDNTKDTVDQNIRASGICRLSNTLPPAPNHQRAHGAPKRGKYRPVAQPDDETDSVRLDWWRTSA